MLLLRRCHTVCCHCSSIVCHVVIAEVPHAMLLLRRCHIACCHCSSIVCHVVIAEVPHAMLSLRRCHIACCHCSSIVCHVVIAEVPHAMLSLRRCHTACCHCSSIVCHVVIAEVSHAMLSLQRHRVAHRRVGDGGRRRLWHASPVRRDVRRAELGAPSGDGDRVVGDLRRLRLHADRDGDEGRRTGVLHLRPDGRRVAVRGVRCGHQTRVDRDVQRYVPLAAADLRRAVVRSAHVRDIVRCRPLIRPGIAAWLIRRLYYKQERYLGRFS